MAKTRKDINKEAMFSKIMPSGASAHNAPPSVKNVQPFDPYEDERDKKSAEVRAELEKAHRTPEEIEAEKKAEEEAKKQQAAKKAQEKAKTQDVEEIINSYSKPEDGQKPDKPEPAPETADENQKPVPAETAPPDKPEPEQKPEPDTAIKVINLHERMVADRMEKALKKFGCCSCTLCRNDAMAMALNSVTPKYIVTTEADVAALTKNENAEEVTAAISKAILYVKANPRH